MKIKNLITVFILAFLAWLALTGVTRLQEVITGLIVSAIVALLAGRFLVTDQKKNSLIKRLIYGIRYILKFLWEMLKANLHVAYIVLHPKLPIKPGIVKISTKLKKDTSLTFLSNSITLTPGTLTVDIDPDKHNLYIHWIDVESEDPDVNTRNVGGRFEPLLTEVFE
ncbi:MAG: Na+/H+ antiporter subunit E [Calditrichaceae bacterium]|jgi:multicomponent Na+:H+ antiporter subunit E